MSGSRRRSERQARREKFEGDEVRYQNELEEWAIVAKGLGPTGIPALRVDLALPGISELPRACFESASEKGRGRFGS